MTVTRADVIAEARSWSKVPYLHQGRSKEGVDCAGLVICVARTLGIVAPDFDVNGYARTPDGIELLAQCDKFMERIRIDQLTSGDVLVLRFENDPQHLGIVGDYKWGGLTLIHAYGKANGKGEVEERRIVAAQKVMKPICGYRLPGVV